MSDTDRTGNDQKKTKQEADQNAVERREFLRRGAAALGAGWLGLGGVRELLAGAEGVAARAYAGAAGVAAAEPFRIAVIGDSVAWGQGLSEAHKYHSKVQAFVASQLNGRPVEKLVRAHSGAVIARSAEDAHALTTVSGEVPRKYPSIIYQATNLIQFPEAIDLVLLDGGANDVGIIETLTAPSVEKVWENTRAVFNDTNYQAFLDLMVKRFPNATIVLTNYYYMISNASRLGVVGDLRQALEQSSPGSMETLIEYARIVATESTAVMQRAVPAVNARNQTSRLLFVDNGFGIFEAMGAPNRMLWDPLERDELGGLGGVRNQLCDAAYPHPRTSEQHKSWLVCYNASIGHPNIAGAAAIASKIIATITPLVPAWAAAKAMTVSVVPGTGTTSSQTITVHARDAATGQPLSGTVRINGTVAPTGQPFTFPKCYTTEPATADSEGPVLKPTSGLRTKTYTECGGTVSAAGYMIGRFQA